ncbi:MAG: hypothetical protein DRP73_05650, partial [Candidatus Omnitrophota bacterium]
RQRQELVNAVIEKLIQGIDEWTEDKFSFWMQKAPGVYTGWRTGYPESDSTYSEFIQMFVSRFINRLEERMEGEEPERINLDEIFEYAKRGGWYINRGTRDCRYVTFEEAMQDIKDRIAEAEQTTAPPVPEPPAEPDQPQQTTEPPAPETPQGEPPADITLPPGIEFAPGEEVAPETAVTPPAPEVEEPAPVEESPAEGVAPQEPAVEPPAPETTHLPAEAPEVVAELTAGEETTQTGTVTPPAEAPVEAPAPEEPVPEPPAEQPQQTTEPPAEVTLPPGIEFVPGEEVAPETVVTSPAPEVEDPAPVEESPAEEVAPQEPVVETPAPETTHPLPAEAPEVVAELTAGEEVTQTGTVTPPAEAPVEAPAPEEPAPQQVATQSSPPVQPEFRFNGWITGPVNAEAGKPVQFVMNGNILQLENPKLIIMDKDGNTVAEMDVTSSTISYTFTSAGRYTAQVVGTKGDETYYTNRFTVNVTSPPQPPQAPQGLNITIDGRNAILTWQETADKYIIELYRDGRRYSSPVTISNNRFSYNWLQPGDYEVRVYAVSEENLVSPDYASQSFTIERPFIFNGSLSGGGTKEVGQTTRFGVWGNVDELDKAELLIKNAQGTEIARIPVTRAGWYEYTWQNPGIYTAQVVGEKEGKTYTTNSVTVRVNPTQPLITPQPPAPHTPEVSQLPVVDVYPERYDLEEWLNPDIKWFKWDTVETADGYLWQLFKVEADGTETPVYTNPDSERIVTRNKLRLDTSELEPGTYIFKVKAVEIDVSGNITNQSPEFGEGRQFTIEAPAPEVTPPENPDEQTSPVETAVQTQEVAASTPVDPPTEVPATTQTTFASRKPLPAEDPDVTTVLTADADGPTETATLNPGEQTEVIPEV